MRRNKTKLRSRETMIHKLEQTSGTQRYRGMWAEADWRRRGTSAASWLRAERRHRGGSTAALPAEKETNKQRGSGFAGWAACTFQPHNVDRLSCLCFYSTKSLITIKLTRIFKKKANVSLGERADLGSEVLQDKRPYRSPLEGGLLWGEINHR